MRRVGHLTGGNAGKQTKRRAPLKPKLGRRVARFFHSEQPFTGCTPLYIYDYAARCYYVAYVKGELMPRGTTLVGCLDNLPDDNRNFMNGHYVRKV